MINSQAQIATLAEMAAPHYLAEGYHSNDHRETVMERSMQIGTLALRHGHAVNMQAVLLGSSWHDAGMGLNPSDYRMSDSLRPAPFSEAVATDLFASEARRQGLDDRFIQVVKGAIMGTNQSVAINSIESQIVAAADLFGVGFDSPTDFAGNTHALWQEAKWRTGQDIQWQDFVKGSINYLGLFMRRNIQLTDDYCDESGRSAWHTGAVRNILHLANHTWESPTVMAYVDHEGVASITIQPKEDEQVLSISTPIVNQAISTPNQSIDTLYVATGLSLNATRLKLALAALKENGELRQI